MSLRVLVCMIALGIGCQRSAAANEPFAGGTCEGCEAVFVGRPSAPAASARIAPLEEPGERLVLEGTVRRAGGTPAPGIIVYAYQTNAAGIYPRATGRDATQHGRLRGFARTGAQGEYRFDTIRPGSYPGTDNPQHIHMHVIEPGRCTYWIDDVNFTDDPLLTEAKRTWPSQGRGGPGIVTPTKRPDGTWHARRDIVLGAGIDDYARFDRAGK
jgi:protocatechuate 3,4-dioxygenase beta subunit